MVSYILVSSFEPFTIAVSLIMAIEDEIEQNRSRFGAQKGISSDEFFGREKFDPSAQAEAKSRLQNFDGATSISSNAYFGRAEEEYPSIDDGYGDLEAAAKDFVRRFGITAGDDLENLSHVLGEGATKLQGRLISFQLPCTASLILDTNALVQVLSVAISTVK